MEVIWQDLGALTTARVSEFWICWRRDNWDLLLIVGRITLYILSERQR